MHYRLLRCLSVATFVSVAALTACTTTQSNSAADHSEHDSLSPSASASVPQTATLPPDAQSVRARLRASPRHAEWVMISAGADSIRAFVVYPERKTKAPVVVVIHEIYGLSPWIRGVTDQLAADGFIAIAPDLLTSKNLPNTEDSVSSELASAAIRTLNQDDVHRWITAAANYAMNLPAAVKRYGVVGFCWGGGVSFGHTVRSPALGASVVYYGTSPDSAALPSVKAPVLGLYGGNDARVNATIPRAESVLKTLGRTYEPHIYEGAGHGFLRQQGGQNGANLTATQQAWPATIAWFRRYLES
jgi:carboxymethylenebutenolidase